VPLEAHRYQRDLIREARFTWGMAAPIAAFAAQVHQESGWRPGARSRYAAGLAQFTPDTAQWIAGLDPELAANQPLDPRWALRALVRYDRRLWERVTGADGCERMAKTLAAYNGGPGHITREERAAHAAGADPARWFGHVERHCLRARWACAENRAYPRRILTGLQPLYLSWGPGVDCNGIA